MADLSQLISHRFRGFAPRENTIQGLNAALYWGVRQVEFDVRVTACGLPLVYHDETAPNQVGHHVQISETFDRDRAELGGAFAHMPTVDDLFAAAAAHSNKAKLLVDMKDAGFEDMLIALAHAHGVADRIVWVSWLPETLYAVRDALPEAKLCLSHWCASPGAGTRSRHRIFTAENGHIPRPDRRHVHGERSGWFVDGPLRGEMREMLQSVCVPAPMVTRALVEDYHRDGIEVSAFSYVTREGVEAAEAAFGHDTFFIDDKAAFDAFQSSSDGSFSA